MTASLVRIALGRSAYGRVSKKVSKGFRKHEMEPQLFLNLLFLFCIWCVLFCRPRACALASRIHAELVKPSVRPCITLPHDELADEKGAETQSSTNRLRFTIQLRKAPSK